MINASTLAAPERLNRQVPSRLHKKKLSANLQWTFDSLASVKGQCSGSISGQVSTPINLQVWQFPLARLTSSEDAAIKEPAVIQERDRIPSDVRQKRLHIRDFGSSPHLCLIQGLGIGKLGCGPISDAVAFSQQDPENAIKPQRPCISVRLRPSLLHLSITQDLTSRLTRSWAIQLVHAQGASHRSAGHGSLIWKYF